MSQYQRIIAIWRSSLYYDAHESPQPISDSSHKHSDLFRKRGAARPFGDRAHSTTSMSRRRPYRIPSTSALIAFESAARHGNFSRAARELHTSQSAISRHIASLERHLSTRLFERSRTGVSLTDAGSRYRDSVTIGLGAIHAGAAEVAELSNEEQVEVVIACSEEVSHIILMPRYDALQKTLGERVQVRILTYHYSEQYLPPRAGPRCNLDLERGKSRTGGSGDRL